MKVVILNGSPRKGGNTEIMAETFANAADKHEVEILNIAPMNIKGCLGVNIAMHIRGNVCTKMVCGSLRNIKRCRYGSLCISNLLV